MEPPQSTLKDFLGKKTNLIILLITLSLIVAIVIRRPELNDAEKLYIQAFEKGMKGQLKEAIKDLNQGIQLNPNDPDYFALRGCLKEDLDLLKEAIKDFDQAIELDPSVADAYAARGSIKLRLDQHDESLQDLTKAIELDPSQSHALFARGSLLAKQKRYDESLSDLDKSMALDPHYVVIGVRAEVLLKMGRKQEAISELERAIEMVNNDSDQELVRRFRETLLKAKYLRPVKGDH